MPANVWGQMMLFQAFNKKLEFPKPSAVVNQTYLDFLAKTYRLSHNGHHGLEHWLRVLLNGRLLAEQNGADLEVVEHFALVHDVMRENENMDLHHGPRAAEFIRSIAGSWIKLEEHRLHKLMQACRYHSVGRLDQDVTIQKYRMNPSNSLFPIDQFRLEICDKYKTLYDLFRLVPTVTDDMSFLEAYRNIVGNYNIIIGDPDRPEPFQKWEYLRIPNDWKTLSYWEQVLVIVFKGKRMMSPKTLAMQLTTLFDCDIINTNITNLGIWKISHNMDKPYAVDPAKGGSQRMTGAKRPYYALTTIPTQLDSAFVNRGNQYKAVQTTNIIYNSTWKQSKKYFKKNSVVYGRGYHDFIYLDTRLEREACDTLRRIDRLLRLSHERGYPVLNKSVAAPYNYANNTSFSRDTMFGVNNYDRTQSYPPLQAAPLIMARSNVGDNAKARIEDPQKTFDRRGMTKAAKMIDVVKVNTGNDDIYYNHPMYPSKQKKDAWGRL